jgi:hypothetical protein
MGFEGLEGRFRDFQASRLKDDEAFISAAINASRTAIATHHREKREALKNALLNVALGRSPEEHQQQTFLRYIEELTVWHLEILLLFQSPMRSF